MDFTPYFGWINVPDPNSPPPGARRVDAETLLRYENGLADAAAEFADLPNLYAALSHTHTIANVNGLQAALNNLEIYTDDAVGAHSASTTGIHGITDTANLVYTDDARLSDSRDPNAHTHAIADITDLDTRLTGIEGDVSTNASDISALQSDVEALPGDTGLRDISGSVGGAWTVDALRIRRRGDTVMLEIANLAPNGATGVSPFDIPAGFGTPAKAGTALISGSEGVTTFDWNGNTITLDPALTYSPSGSTHLYWETTEAWPDTLPGTAA